MTAKISYWVKTILGALIGISFVLKASELNLTQVASLGTFIVVLFTSARIDLVENKLDEVQK